MKAEGGAGRAGRLDVLVVSLASTTGLREADEELAASLRRAGASVELAVAERPPEVRTLALTDLLWARAARSAAQAALRRAEPQAVIYSTTTAALLWPRPGAIRFDATAAGNRPARHGLWQRPLERRRLARSPLLLPLSAGALAEAGPRLASAAERALVVPLPVDPSGPPAAVRDIAAITYAGNPRKKGLDRVLAAWRSVREEGVADGGELLVAGAGADELRAAGIDLEREPGVRDAGRLAQSEYRALLRRARVFVTAPRREDYGQAQLEALADGCLLASTPAPGPYAALPIARRLDERLVDADLPAALAAALGRRDSAGYAERALRELAPMRGEAVQRLVAQELLPRLGAPAA
ncbi:MAG TPA: glycosyltransferase [Solirubrobacteraceae bacterium]|jgi:glycosyltransferase involved in cell wall biosynthesis|nr:glycosyltransferase [Solirubrobacteraceae bacterium]